MNIYFTETASPSAFAERESGWAEIFISYWQFVAITVQGRLQTWDGDRKLESAFRDAKRWECDEEVLP